MRDSFIIYRSFYEAISDLPATEQAAVWKAICEYSLNFELIELSGMASTVFKLVRPQLDANIKRYANGKKQDGSKLKAKPKQKGSETEANEKQKGSKREANENVNDNVNENVNVKESPRFAAPTLDEVKDFFKENGYTTEAATKAFTYYSEAQWRDSRGQTVKNWKQKMRGVWFRDEHKHQAPQPYNPRAGAVPAVYTSPDNYRPA